MGELAKLPNIGKVLEAQLEAVGIATPEAARAGYGPSRSGAAGSGKLEFERDASAYDQYFDDEEDRLP